MICIKCDIDKTEDQFPFRNKSKNTRQYTCLVCKRSVCKQHYRDNKQYYKERNILQREKIRDFLLEYKSIMYCNICGENHIATLQFHHINPKEKDLELGKVIQAGWSIERIKKEILKCKILCANCHYILHWNERNGFIVQ